MEAARSSVGRKRALDADDERRDSPRASSESENVSPRLLDAQVGLPTPAGGHVGVAGAGSERGRVTGAIKSRRLSQDLGQSPAQFVAKLTALSGPASPALRVFMGDAEAARTPTAFVGSPFELKKAAGGLARPLFPLGAQAPGRPAIPTPLGTPNRVPEQKTSPPGQLRRLDGGIAARTGGPGLSPLGNQEQKSPVLQARPVKPLLMKAGSAEIPLAERGLPTISHLLGAGGQENNSSPAFGSLTTPYRVPTATSTTAPSSKQVTKRQPFPFPQRRNLEPPKGISTPVLDSGGVRNSVSNAPMPSFDIDDVSSDEELMGIPGPDIPDPEISFSQEKLGDLSVTENNLEDSVVLTLCDGLANSLTKAERDRMELLNLYTIALAQQPSPIMLGRDQFQDIFGDNIRGGMLSHLSRRHCLIHVENVPSQNDSAKMGVKVRVEDTSTNGIRVNGVQLKNGQTMELDLDDVVTLLRIRRDEDDVSLEYKLVRSDPPTEKPARRSRKSRHDGRYVRPSDKFSSRAIAHETRHQIPSGPFVQGDDAPFLENKEVETSKPEPVQQLPTLTRKIRCTILFADQSTQDFSDSSQPLEEANFDYREELSEVLSAFAAVRAFDASSYHCATTESIRQALHGSSDVVFYTGGGDEDHLVVEAPNGLSARLEKDDAHQLFSDVKSSATKLIVVITPTAEPARLLAGCGAPHVCFLSSASKHSLRVTAFIRALFAGFLKGFSIEKSYALAEFVALNDLLPIKRDFLVECAIHSSVGNTLSWKRHHSQKGQGCVNSKSPHKLVEHIQSAHKPETDSEDQDFRRSNQREDPLSLVIEGVETLLRSLPEMDSANYPATLLVLDGCDIVLPALGMFVLNIVQTFPGVQVLLTSSEELQIDTGEDSIIPEEVVHVGELSKLDSAKLFFKLARGHLTSRQFRQYFPDSSIEVISNDERLLSTKGNPFRISRLVYELESQTTSGNN
ncbi:uncharacterized protein IUM83_16190 [Phytophthora cinnamomi]|uniref:uncharacterized protein n=1 Tax=Phytophthora cinnamomi TaxID=4785 RepID=UPI003559F4A5|nr:hypothetical protein IUM83_16190 [Phytophthora cinnamomi]